MNKDLYNMIIKYNQVQQGNADMAKDLQTILDEIKKLPYGQFKKVVTDEVMNVLKKYGVEG